MVRYRWAVLMVLASVLILVGSVIGNVVYTRSVQEGAAAKAEKVRTQQVATCQSSNEARSLQVQLWDYVLSFPPSRPRTEAQEKKIADFKAFVRKTFAPRDCSKT